MYLDPGFGGMLLQVIVAIIAVGGAILFSVRKKIKRLFSKDKTETSSFENIQATDNDDDAIDVLND